MTVFFHTGFDLFGMQANADNDGPVHGAGLTLHPGKPTLVNTNAAGREHAVGVSGLDRYKVGSGANRRNALVIYSGNKTQAGGNYTATFPLPAGVLPAVIGARAVFGFRFKRQRVVTPGVTPPNAYHNVIMINGVPLFGFNPTAGSTQYFLHSTSTTSNFEFKEGQEYYIEIVLTRPTTTQAIVEMWVDGTRVFAPGTVTQTAITTMAFGNAGGNYAWNQAVSISDVYVGDARIGPQMVLSRQPSIATVANWIPSQGNDGLALISGANTTDDTKYITSPADTAEDRYRLDFNLPAGFLAHAASLFVRGKRDAASTRKVKAAVFNRSTGAELQPAASVVTEFSQNAWRTDLLWQTDVADTLKAENLNSIDVSLTSPLT